MYIVILDDGSKQSILADNFELKEESKILYFEKNKTRRVAAFNLLNIQGFYEEAEDEG